MNGAPNFKLKEDNEGNDIYYLEDMDRAKIKYPRWFYAYRALPTIKFQTFYNSGKVSMPFLGAPKVAKTSIKPTEISNYTSLYYKNNYNYTNYGIISSLKKTISPTEKNPTIIASKAYEFIKNTYFEWDVNDLLKNPSSSRSMRASSDIYFINTFSSFLRSKNISHDITFGIPRFVSSLDNLVLKYELVAGIRITSTKEAFYVQPPDFFEMYKEVPAYLEGTEVYACDAKSTLTTAEPRIIQIPASTYLNNRTESIIEVKFSGEEENTLQVNYQVISKGKNRVDFQEQFIQPFHLIEDYYITHTPPLITIEKEKDKAKTLTKVRDYVKLKSEENKTYLEERVKSMLENDFSTDKITIKDFKLQQLGIREEKPEIKFSVQYEIEDFIKKVGPNYLLDLGKLIGGQIELEKEEMERQYDVYMPYPRSFKNEITFIIPDGYVAEGIDKFNFEVKNETGGFISSARLEGNKVILNTEKYYTNNFEPKENWSKITDFLEATFQFTQQKVLLRKGV